MTVVGDPVRRALTWGCSTAARAVVTGGASGIGAETCRRFAEEGAEVAVLDRDGERRRWRRGRDRRVAFEVDVRDPDAVTAAVRPAAERLGGLTDLVANAGTGMAKPLLDYTDKEFALLVGVNLTGTFNAHPRRRPAPARGRAAAASSPTPRSPASARPRARGRTRRRRPA